LQERAEAAGPHSKPEGDSTRMQPQATGGMELPCQSDPELFFAEKPQDIWQAKSLCRRCPVRRACLAGALERGEPWGVWGGELFQNGVITANKRARGRPRRAHVAA
jgi:WhiB family redox-sensing transcriptional regulator